MKEKTNLSDLDSSIKNTKNRINALILMEELVIFCVNLINRIA
jgi:hypothetical protein